MFVERTMRIVGIMGGVASGKSLVGKWFAQRGVGVLDADRAGHEVLRQPEVEAAARLRWGAEIFGPDGHIDRPRLARIVFAPTAEGTCERRYLEQLTHPAIGKRIEAQAGELAAAGRAAAVLDAALLVEAGWDRLCDKLLFVHASRRVRLARALQRGWTEEEFTARENAQQPLDMKRARADLVIDNSGSPEETWAQLDSVWPTLLE